MIFAGVCSGVVLFEGVHLEHAAEDGLVEDFTPVPKNGFQQKPCFYARVFIREAWQWIPILRIQIK
jgi:hypothetical protein